MLKSIFIYSIVFLFLGFTSECIGQDNDPELAKLHNELHNAKKDTSRILALLKIAGYYKMINTDSSLVYAKSAYKLAHLEGFIIERAAVALANAYSIQNDFLRSTEYLMEAYKEAEKTRNTKQYAFILNSMGTNYLMLKNNEQAKKYFILANKYSIGYRSRFITTYNIGQANMYLYNYTEAQKYYEDAMKIAESEKNDKDIALVYNRLGALNHLNKYFEKGLYYFKKVRDMNLPNDDYDNTLNMNCIAESYLQLKRYDEGIKMGLFVDSVAEANSFLSLLVDNSQTLSDLYNQNGNPAKALDYYKKYTSHKDSLMTLENTKQINFLNLQFETKQKEERIEALNREMQLKRVLNYVYIVAGLLTIIILVFFIRNFKQRNKILVLEKERMEQQREKEALLKKKLEMELFERDREILMHVMQINQQKEMLSTFQEQVDSIVDKQEPELLYESVNQLKSAIGAKIKVTDDWEQIKMHFEKVHPAFFSQLKTEYENLTVNELKLCAYIKLKFSIKEISRLLSVNHTSIQMSRYRLKKKLGIPENVNIDDFIASRN